MSKRKNQKTSVTHTYKNPWFNGINEKNGPEFYSTDTRPVEYRSFYIFNRHKSCHELVKDGVCLTQRAGGGELRELADALLGEKTSHPRWLIERAREVAIKNKVTLCQLWRAA